MTTYGIKILQLSKATPVEEEQIRLSLIELRRRAGLTMAGIDDWCLYYPAAQQSINVVPIPIRIDRSYTLSASSSNDSLNALIAAADERLGS